MIVASVYDFYDVSIGFQAALLLVACMHSLARMVTRDTVLRVAVLQHFAPGRHDVALALVRKQKELMSGRVMATSMGLRFTTLSHPLNSVGGNHCRLVR